MRSRDFVSRSRLPKLPDPWRKHRPHHSPMSHRAGLMPFCDHLRVIPHQNSNILSVELCLHDFVLWLQEHLTRSTTQEVLNNRVSERQRGFGLLAEDYHVGEVHLGSLKDRGVRWALTEDTTRGEDLVDGVDDDLWCWPGEITGVVLDVVVSMEVQLELEGVETHDCDDTIGLEERAETLEKLQCEEIDRLCATREHIVHDVIVSRGLICKISGVLDGILQHWDIVLL